MVSGRQYGRKESFLLLSSVHERRTEREEKIEWCVGNSKKGGGNKQRTFNNHFYTPIYLELSPQFLLSGPWKFPQVFVVFGNLKKNPPEHFIKFADVDAFFLLKHNVVSVNSHNFSLRWTYIQYAIINGKDVIALKISWIKTPYI